MRKKELQYVGKPKIVEIETAQMMQILKAKREPYVRNGLVRQIFDSLAYGQTSQNNQTG